MTVNIFLVQSPLQTLCALEVSLRCPDDFNVIVCKFSELPGRVVNNKQMEMILNHGVWAESLLLKPGLYVGRISVHLCIAKALRSLNEKYLGKVQKMYMGDFRSKWMHQARLAVRPQDTWLLDDGAASINTIDMYIKKGDFFPSKIVAKENLLKTTLWKVVYGRYQRQLHDLKCSPVNVFSAFLSEESAVHSLKDGGTISLVRNDLNMIRTCFSSKNLGGPQGGEVYYYGSKYSEAGIVSLEYELSFLKRVAEYYSNKNLVVRYFSHRDESDLKLAEVCKIFPDMVVRDQEVAEVSLLVSGEYPEEFAAAYSSVLQSVGLLFPDIKKTSFKFCDSEIALKFRADVSRVYHYYEGQGVNVVNFS